MNPIKTIYIFERGILGWETLFGDYGQWTNEACVWIHRNTPHRAATLNYFSFAITAGFTRPRRARQFAKLIEAYRGWRIVMVCHSEGTATGLRALRDAHWPLIHELHLVCGAADSDFQANGLNRALTTGAIGHAYVYVAGKDKAMKLENSYIGCACFGLQTGGQPLGLHGPTNVSPEAWRRLTVIRSGAWEDYGHSTCWEPLFFERTMRQLTHTPADVCIHRVAGALRRK